jgi:hypothetical protein
MVKHKLGIASIAILWACLQSTLAAADSTVLANPVAILKGDSWTYKKTDEVTDKVISLLSFTVTELNAKSIVARMTNKIGNTNSLGIAVFDPNWNLMDDVNSTYTPNDGRGLPENYKIGSEWNTSYQWKSNSVKSQGTGVSVGSCPTTEHIHLKIGNFLALQCVVRSTFLTGNAVEDAVTKKIVIETTSWYAPEVGNWVKQTALVRVDGHLLSQTSSEIVSFNVLGVNGESSGNEGVTTMSQSSQGSGATSDRCVMQGSSTVHTLIAKVTREISPVETQAATAAVEKQIGVNISPTYADLKRVLVVSEADQKFQTLAAIPPSLSVAVGDVVTVAERHRDGALLCNFVPWTVEKVITKAK